MVTVDYRINFESPKEVTISLDRTTSYIEKCFVHWGIKYSRSFVVVGVKLNSDLDYLRGQHW